MDSGLLRGMTGGEEAKHASFDPTHLDYDHEPGDYGDSNSTDDPECGAEADVPCQGAIQCYIVVLVYMYMYAWVRISYIYIHDI